MQFLITASLFQRFAHFLRAGRSRIEHTEAALRVLGDDLGERRLAGAGWTIEDERAKPIGDEHSPQQFAFAEEMFLADELVDGSRTHARGERPGASAIIVTDVGEDVDGSLRMSDGPIVDR